MLANDYFPNNTLATMGIDTTYKKYVYNNDKYKIYFIDSNGQERFRSIILSYLKIANIVIYLIDLTQYKTINVEFINNIRENLKDNSLIYVVGNKLDLTGENIEENIELNIEYQINIEKYRDQAKSLIENKTIDKYFEVSAKNKKGVDILLKNIELYLLRDKSHHMNIYLNKNKSEKDSSIKANKITKFPILNKYLNF